MPLRKATPKRRQFLIGRNCLWIALLAGLFAMASVASAQPDAQPDAQLVAEAAAKTVGKDTQDTENRFNDPFYQFTFAVADCPEPLGPLITLAEQRAQAHHRAERGTSCWLAKQCDRPNAYLYDADIAAALKEAVKPTQLYTHSPLVNSSLWATVQGRTITVEGCVAGDVPMGFDHNFITRNLDVLLRSIPQVQQAVVRVRTSAQARAGMVVPYPIRSR